MLPQDDPGSSRDRKRVNVKPYQTGLGMKAIPNNKIKWHNKQFLINLSRKRCYACN